MDLGSLGPSTVTFIALLYVVICGGDVDTVIVNEKLFPGKLKERNKRKLLHKLKQQKGVANLSNWYKIKKKTKINTAVNLYFIH